MLIHDLDEVRKDYEGLVIRQGDDGSLTARGALAFSANYADKGAIEDTYSVDIFMPAKNSTALPTAKETGGRIKDFHVNQDGTLCLGALVEIRRRRLQDSSLRGFIEGLVIPFLYSFSYKEKYNSLPFDDLPHGGEGTLKYYREFFKVDSNLSVIEFLRILTMDNYKGHFICPCGSGLKMRSCHGNKLREIRTYQSRKDFLADFAVCLDVYAKSGERVSRGFFSKRLERYWDRNISSALGS